MMAGGAPTQSPRLGDGAIERDGLSARIDGGKRPVEPFFRTASSEILYDGIETLRIFGGVRRFGPRSLAKPLKFDNDPQNFAPGGIAEVISSDEAVVRPCGRPHCCQGSIAVD